MKGEMDALVRSGWVAGLANDRGFEVVEQHVLPAREPTFSPIPETLHPALQEALAESFPQGLYSHQVDAISRAVAGDDVCVATSTASGKSLVFMATAANLLLNEPTMRVLALYPARALIQDQLDKWRAFAVGFGLSIGYIDGDVPMDRRPAILRASSIVLMTPDVAHAWLLSHLDDSVVRTFVDSVRLLVLDEAHVYDGVFGTNMCFMLRRLFAVAPGTRFLMSTATLHEPAAFAAKLTGRSVVAFGKEADGAGAPEKHILLASSPARGAFERKADLLRALAGERKGRFLAFADSRRTVEMLVSVLGRLPETDGEEEEPPSEAAMWSRSGILPYRAGYEHDDRTEIQHALSNGTLAGVVSTSALELGLDIGEINLVVMLNAPSSTKAFWQRLGRAGRRSAGTCLILDGERSILGSDGGLSGYLSRPAEPNWLYLDNRYIQYANALCAAQELKSTSRARADLAEFSTLPDAFVRMLQNELDPCEAIPPDLYPLKQKGHGGPHREFPLRSAMEQNFQVIGPLERRLGTLTLSQALREAYPGAVYHYMGRPHRVKQMNYRSGFIRVSREKRRTTRPIAQAKVFPRFGGGVLAARRSGRSFVAECEMQVSERVLGFVESVGAAKVEHRYGPGSSYSQRELNRFFETTGVCWLFPEQCGRSERVADAIRQAYCYEYSIQERDLGVGFFFAKSSLCDDETCEGACVFDATNGSLRLSQRLTESFDVVLRRAAGMCRVEGDEVAARDLLAMALYAEEMTLGPPDGSIDAADSDGQWVALVAPRETAMHWGPSGSEEVVVKGFRYTPQGILYELEPATKNSRWLVRHETIQPIHGVSRMVRYNLVTGDEAEV
ncbi:MAG: DEAD/DEAH box helicase [Deltaproteobacteria bacterium]|nr:DEAD/DEAH box helicase [Deltaproteobacteria bacterium]